MALAEAEAIYARIQECIDNGTYSVATVLQVFKGKNEDEKKRMAALRKGFYRGIHQKISDTPAPSPACEATRDAALSLFAEINTVLDAIAGPEDVSAAENHLSLIVGSVWTEIAQQISRGDFTPETTMARIRLLPENEQKDEAKCLLEAVQEMLAVDESQDLTEQVKLYRSLVLTTLARTERALLEFLQ